MAERFTNFLDGVGHMKEVHLKKGCYLAMICLQSGYATDIDDTGFTMHARRFTYMIG